MASNHDKLREEIAAQLPPDGHLSVAFFNALAVALVELDRAIADRERQPGNDRPRADCQHGCAADPALVAPADGL